MRYSDVIELSMKPSLHVGGTFNAN